MTRHNRWIWLAVLAATTIAGCDAGSFVEVQSDTQSKGPVTLVLDSLTDMLVEDDTATLAARLFDEAGDLINDATLTWHSSDTSIATLEPAGTDATITARHPGETTITVVYEEASASTTVRVHNRPADLVYVSGSGQAGEAGMPLPDSLAVQVLDRRGDPVSGVRIDFAATSGGGSLSPGQTTTDAQGYARSAWTLGDMGSQAASARASEGQTRVKQMKDSTVAFTASMGAVVADVAVTPASPELMRGESLDLDAVARDQRGDPVSGMSVTWASSNSAVATVDTTGLVVATGEGSATISATCDGVTGTAQLTVVSADTSIAVASVTVSPAGDTLAAGATLQLSAAVADSQGNPLSSRSIAWSSSDAAIVTVDGAGLATAVGPGEAAITATSDGISGAALITVTAAAKGTITLSPPSDTLVGIGTTLTVSAQARDAAGNMIADPGISWSSSDPNIVSVDNMGTLKARAIGIAVITASAVCCADATGSYLIQADDPAAVTDLQISSEASSSITLQWTQVDDGAGEPADYAIRYGSPTLSWGSANGTEVAVSGSGIGSTLTYTFNGLSGGTDYQFQLVTYRGTLGTDAVFGPLSNMASGTTTSVSGGALAAGTASAAGGDGMVTLSATAATGGTSPYTYQWHRSTTSGFTPGQGNALSAMTTRSATDGGVTNGTTYYYVLVARDNTGASVTYGQVSATPASAPTGDGSEPTYDPASNTLVYQDDMSKYSDINTMGTVNSGSPEIAPYVSPVFYPPPWNPGGFDLITGRGGAGQALRIHRSGADQSSGSFRTNNMPTPSNGARQFFTYWARVTMAQPLSGTLAVKWFMGWHADGSSRVQWNTHDRLPCTSVSGHPTYWQVYDDGGTTTCQANQPVGPYFPDIADGQWHRFTYEYKPNTSRGARDGVARMWVDGVKIIDISASAVGVTPPGGDKPWCQWDDVDGISTNGIVDVHWGSTQTTSSPAWTMDIDDFYWWTQ